MNIKRPSTLAIGAAILLAASGAAIPASKGIAAKLVDAPLLSYDPTIADPAEVAAAKAQVSADQASMTAIEPASIPVSPAPEHSSVSADADSVECMAKVILHEAGNQPRVGKVAVAQTLVNRLKAGRFGGSICEVVGQKGQYFRIAQFHPRRDTDGWQAAVEIAHAVLDGDAEPVAPGAMYFRANYAPTNAFFRTRQRVTTVGAHVFYR